MKKSVFSFFMLFLLSMFLNQSVFAQTVTLNVNAKKSAVSTNEYKNWKEKAMYKGSPVDFSITVNAKAAANQTSDLIVKMDVVESSSGTMKVTSYWLKYDRRGMQPWYGIWMYQNGEEIDGLDGNETIEKGVISSLALKKGVDSKGVTITLFDFPMSDFKWDAHVIFSAFLVDDVSQGAGAQIVARDVQIIYFDPDWKTLLQSASNPSP